MQNSTLFLLIGWKEMIRCLYFFKTLEKEFNRSHLNKVIFQNFGKINSPESPAFARNELKHLKNCFLLFVDWLTKPNK